MTVNFGTNYQLIHVGSTTTELERALYTSLVRMYEYVCTCKYVQPINIMFVVRAAYEWCTRLQCNDARLIHGALTVVIHHLLQLCAIDWTDFMFHNK